MKQQRPSKLTAWIAASRLPTLWAAVSPVVVGSACVQQIGGFDAAIAAACLLGAMFIQLGTNYVNDVADHGKGADRSDRLGPPRAVSAGWLSAKQMVVGAVIAFSLATLCGLYLLSRTGWPVVVIGVASIIAGIAYTSGPFPLAYIGLGDVFVMLFFGFVAVCGTAYLQAGVVPPSAWICSVAVGALGVGILGVNNLRDRHGDRRSSKRTLVVRFGEEFGRAFVISQIGLAYAVVALLVLFGFRGALLALLSLPLAVLLIRGVARADGAALNPLLGGVARLQLVFCVLLAAGLVWLS